MPQADQSDKDGENAGKRREGRGGVVWVHILNARRCSLDRDEGNTERWRERER